MNVLEKILEEIEERVNFRERLVKYEKRMGTITDVCRNKGALGELDIIAEIIRSHMNELPKCVECSRRKWYQKGYKDGKKDNGWIPVEDRLPEDVKDCLVTVKYTGFMGMHGAWIKTGHLEFNNEWCGGCSGGEVIAWQPLPEPYKAKNNKKS